MPAPIQTNGFPAFIDPPTYQLARTSVADGDATNGWQAWIYRKGLSAVALDLPAHIVTGGDAHKYMQAAFVGARYAPQSAPKAARKYRGKYPSAIKMTGVTGNLVMVDTNDGRRYSIPVNDGLPLPKLGDCVGAFERTDEHGATYSPDYGTKGENMTEGEIAAICARYDDARRDIAAPLKTEIAKTWAKFLPAMSEPAPAVRRDNVEYHAGRDAWAANKTKDSNPYPAGGERAARWDLGWQTACDNAAPVSVARVNLRRQANEMQAIAAKERNAMPTKEALEIVLSLAEDNVIDDDDMKEERKRQKAAIRIVSKLFAALS